MTQKLTKIQFLLLYGLALGSLLLLSLMAWSNYRFMVIDHATELYLLLIAGVFVSVGIWVGLRWSAPTIIEKMVLVPMPTSAVSPEPNQQVLEHLGISPRELAVLVQLSKGLSNDEIAGQLFVSTNTVKTHLANLYTKLDVKRRTQGVEKARVLGLV
ncbi:MAG: LuxR C-terminal-related transcriptional regulator [Rudanella sp.]|nr:LuxR C-terminal-related transcriptional regulator [Rudanella sp.]